MKNDYYFKNKIGNDPGIEAEAIYDNDSEPQITEPFDPKKVDIAPRTLVLSNVVDMIRHDDIDLAPDFQRNKVWSKTQQSRLIESLLILIPLPSFYFDESDDEKLTVVDGLQRLWTFKRFFVLDKSDPEKLKLENLEYLKDYEGSYFEDLPWQLQRRLNNTSFNAYVIKSETPEDVRISVFTRINTGGVNLLPAEIRNSVYRGKAAETLKKLAKNNEFIKATRGKVSPDRMADCELINRFMAFYILELSDYKENLEEYLNKALKKLKTSSDLQIQLWSENFIKSMILSSFLFGNNAFRKKLSNGKYGGINKPLFECVSVLFAKLTDAERKNLENNKEFFLEYYYNLFDDENFYNSITSGTAKISSINIRYRKISDVIQRVIG